MQIEIVTTKKKLTKSLVKQMMSASHWRIKDALNPSGSGKVIGYLTDCHKGANKLAIIHHTSDYYTVPMYLWRASEAFGGKRLTAKCDNTKGSVICDCDSKEQADDILDVFKKLRHAIVRQHIYL